MKERVDWTDDMVMELLEFYEKRADSFQSLGVTFFSDLTDKLGIPMNRISEKFIRLKHQFKNVYENGGRKGSLTRDSNIYKKMEGLFSSTIIKSSPGTNQTNGLVNFKVNEVAPLMALPEPTSPTAMAPSKEIMCPPIQPVAPDSNDVSLAGISAFYPKTNGISVSAGCVSAATIPQSTPSNIEAHHLSNSAGLDHSLAPNQIPVSAISQFSIQPTNSNQPQVSLSSNFSAPYQNDNLNDFAVEEDPTFKRQEVYLMKLKQEQDHALEIQKQEQIHAVEMRRLELAERELAYKEAKLALRREKLQHRWTTMPQENMSNQARN